MSDDPKLTKEAFVRILAEARADEIADDTAAMTSEEHEAFIAKAGVTKADREASLERQRKKFEAVVAKQAKETVPTAPRNVRFGSARRAAFMSSGLTLAAAAAVVFVLGKADMLPHGTGPIPTVTGAGAGNPQAEEARLQAFRAYVRGSWQECLDDLDKAKELDPRGDETDPTVAIARASAKRMLAATKDGG